MDPGGQSLRPSPEPRSPPSIRKRTSSVVRAAAEATAKATANFFGLSTATHGDESQKWEMRRAELLRRRFGNARQPADAAVAPFGDEVDYVPGLEAGRPTSLPVQKQFAVGAAAGLPPASLPVHRQYAVPPTTLPLVVVQGATPARGGITPGAMSTTSMRRVPSMELRRDSVSTMALNTLKNAVRRRPSSKVWSVVQDAPMLPSPMDSTASLVGTPMSPAGFTSFSVTTPLEEREFMPVLPEEYIADADVPDLSIEREHRRELRSAPKARTAFLSLPPQLQVSAVSEESALEEPPPPQFDGASDIFYDLPRNYFVTRGWLDHCHPTTSAALSRFQHLSAITEVTSSTSSLQESQDETDLAASVLQTRSTQCIPAVFDDPDMIPKLASLEGIGDTTDGFFSVVVDRSERSVLPFRVIAQILGRNEMARNTKQGSGQQHGSGLNKPAKKRGGSKKPSTFDSNMLDNRAFFTYWITLVHVAIFLFSVISYGIAPIGFDTHTTQELVMREWGVSQLVSRSEPENMWIGPSQASLVHLGARYAPCMRVDSNINNLIERERDNEEESGCCIRNDRTGCIQSPKTYCTDAVSTWLKWPNSLATRSNSGTHSTNYTHGPVCGLDPEYCLHPSSVAPFTWSNNITKWPICTKPVPHEEIPKDVLHMHCDIIGRPCCVGLVGQCILTTREYCEFQNGYFHQEAFLCSQVSCMGDVCGMMPFADEEKPDQFYRLWTSLFLHAGVLHLLISVLFQMTIMRHLEKYAGWLRISIIYLLSGLVGNLASAIFTPYHAEAGPTGSHFGLIACLVVSLIVDIVHYKAQYMSPCLAVVKILVICVLLFAIGLLPFIDNWAHIFGFVFGAILSCMLLPDVELRRMTRATTVVVCLLLSAGILVALVLLFYFFPVYECEACAYLNCIPFTPTFCATRRIQLPNLVKA